MNEHEICMRKRWRELYVRHSYVRGLYGDTGFMSLWVYSRLTFDVFYRGTGLPSCGRGRGLWKESLECLLVQYAVDPGPGRSLASFRFIFLDSLCMPFLFGIYSTFLSFRGKMCCLIRNLKIIYLPCRFYVYSAAFLCLVWSNYFLDACWIMLRLRLRTLRGKEKDVLGENPN